MKRLSHLVSVFLLQFVHGPLQPLLQQVHQPHRVSRPGLKLLPEQEKTHVQTFPAGAELRPIIRL